MGGSFGLSPLMRGLIARRDGPPLATRGSPERQDDHAAPAAQPHERTVRLRRRPLVRRRRLPPLAEELDAAPDRRDRDRAQAPLRPRRRLVVLGHQLLRPRADRRSGDEALPRQRTSRPNLRAPLSLDATSFLTGPRVAGRYAHGYFLRPLQDVSVGSPSVQWAAGALVSNADELAASTGPSWAAASFARTSSG
jgi:hypothetical protein